MIPCEWDDPTIHSLCECKPCSMKKPPCMCVCEKHGPFSRSYFKWQIALCDLTCCLQTSHIRLTELSCLTTMSVSRYNNENRNQWRGPMCVAMNTLATRGLYTLNEGHWGFVPLVYFFGRMFTDRLCHYYYGLLVGACTVPLDTHS